MIGALLGKKYWFAFSYIGDGDQCGDGQSFATTYTGYFDKNITIERIQENKMNAGVSNDATLIAVSYLGYMTRRKMSGE